MHSSSVLLRYYSRSVQCIASEVKEKVDILVVCRPRCRLLQLMLPCFVVRLCPAKMAERIKVRFGVESRGNQQQDDGDLMWAPPNYADHLLLSFLPLLYIKGDAATMCVFSGRLRCWQSYSVSCSSLHSRGTACPTYPLPGASFLTEQSSRRLRVRAQ